MVGCAFKAQFEKGVVVELVESFVLSGSSVTMTKCHRLIVTDS